MPAPPTLEITYYPVTDLRPYYRNAHKGNTKRIRGSLRDHRQYKTITVNKGTHTGRPNEVLCGNHTLDAAAAEGWPTLGAVTIDVGEDEAAQINLIDNPRAGNPQDLDYDERLLLELLTGLPSLDGTGYDPHDIANLAALLDEPAWGTGGGGSGGDHGEPDDTQFWPQIKMRVPPVVFDQWRTLIDGYDGKDDVEKLTAMLADR